MTSWLAGQGRVQEVAMRVAIIGSGPAGMTAALLLARLGHRIALIDRDPGPIAGQEWHRVGVMQFHLPHGFRHQCRALLEAQLPDVLEAVLAAGAVVSAMPGAPASAAPLLVRRSVFERALWEATTREPEVRRVTGHASDVVVAGGSVTGVVVDDAVVPADLVVDASGRSGLGDRSSRGELPGMAPASASQRVECGMAYAARQYRLRPGAEPGPRTGGPAFLAQHPGFTALVFEHDAGTFTVLFVRAVKDTSLALLRHPAAFEAACRAVPGVSTWTDPQRSEPIDVVRAGAGLTNEYRGQPTGVTGLVAIGDALCVTNPQGARGIPLGLQTAAVLADLVAGGAAADLSELAARLDAWAGANLRPWFLDHVEWDASLLARWAGRPVDPDGPIGPEALLAAAQQHHPEWRVMLGLYLGMMITPDVLAPLREEVRTLLRTGWQPPPLEGLSRDELKTVITRALITPDAIAPAAITPAAITPAAITPEASPQLNAEMPVSA
jgi:2-polyprenyl-6-methoxyphenol hydroxylase-like FAD-dependent oxidoreductase